MNRLDLILIAVGTFALCGAGFDWEWFMNHRKARFFTAIFELRPAAVPGNCPSRRCLVRVMVQQEAGAAKLCRWDP
jgi:hypothetical protein